MTGPTHEFWQQRFEANEMPWDCGAASPQLGEWLASGALARCRVLVPGCGGGYEVVALARAGFDVTALDSAPAARWEWTSPPYPQVPHPRGWAELAVVLTHRNQGF